MINNGVKLGLTCSLITTFFDSFFMLLTNVPVPLSYPVHLLVVNTLFWTTFGGFIGTVGTIFCRGLHFTPLPHRYWIWFYLLPFSVLYGLLGRLQLTTKITHGGKAPPPASVFDNSLSFVWVIILLIISFRFHKSSPVRKKSSILFLPEISLTCAIFIFCHLLIPETEKRLSLPVGMTAGVYTLGLLAIFCTFWFSLTKLQNWRPQERLLTIVLFLLVCLTLTFCYQAKKIKLALRISPPAFGKIKTNKSPSTNVILVVMDTVRANRLSLYGGNPQVGKNLAILSEKSLVFENCIASSSWTYPSHASLFTGLYPVEHGAHHIIENTQAQTNNNLPLLPLDERFNTLAEIFTKNAYRTLAVISNFGYFHPNNKLGQGFQIFDRSKNIGYLRKKFSFTPIIHNLCFLNDWAPRYALPYRTAEEISNSAINYIDQVSAAPFFLFLNYNDAHTPVMPPRRYSKEYYKGISPLMFKLSAILPWNFKIKYFRDFFTSIQKEKPQYDLSQYDGAITYIDYHLGRLFDNLIKRGLYDSSLIVVTSDHGELFREHGRTGHMQVMYESQMAVPLLIKFPHSQKTGRVNKLTGLHDLFAIILSASKTPIPEDISGFPSKNHNDFKVAELYDAKFGTHRVLYDGDYKLFLFEKNKSAELYNLKNDPLEKVNLYTEKPEIVLAMEKKLEAWQKKHKARYTPDKTVPIISNDVKDELKALGYIQ